MLRLSQRSGPGTAAPPAGAVALPPAVAPGARVTLRLPVTDLPATELPAAELVGCVSSRHDDGVRGTVVVTVDDAARAGAVHVGLAVQLTVGSLGRGALVLATTVEHVQGGLVTLGAATGAGTHVEQRRSFARVATELDVTVVLPGTPLRTTTVDLSEGGMRVRLPETVPGPSAGQRATVLLSLPTGRVAAQAVVVAEREAGMVRLRFVDLSANAAKAVRRQVIEEQRRLLAARG